MKTLTTLVGAALAIALSGATATAERSTSQAPQRYYLALGDSMAYGYQPTKRPGAPAGTFDTGYVDVVAARLHTLAPKIQVVNYGCPGESTVTYVRGGCPGLHDGFKLHDPFRGSQQKAALAFLRAHPGEVSPITVTLWGNDLAPISQHGAKARADIAAFAPRFAAILRQLRAAAPKADIIVSGAWNPEADKLARVEPLYRSIDAAIARAATASHARVANTYTALDGSGSLKAQQARLCRLTFYCSKQDPHPTDAGYRVMGDAFYAASGY